MERIAMEENRVTRFQFAVNQLHPVKYGIDSLKIGPGLIARFAMFDPAHFV